MPEFEWDPDKAWRNQRIHGVSFPAATGVFFDPNRLEDADLREDYGEERFFTIGFASQLLLAVAYTIRNKRIRLISARKANRYEEEDYQKHRIPTEPRSSAPDDRK